MAETAYSRKTDGRGLPIAGTEAVVVACNGYFCVLLPTFRFHFVILLRNNPDNVLACDYLLCFDLLNKDIGAFARDYQEFAAHRIPSRLYAEGLLVYLAGNKSPLDEVRKWNIPPQVLDEFGDYTDCTRRMVVMVPLCKPNTEKHIGFISTMLR